MVAPMPALLTAAWILVASSATQTAAVTDLQKPASEGVYELRHDWVVDGAITVAAGALWLGSEYVFKENLAPTQCRLFCETEVNGLDTWGRNLRWGDSGLKTAALLSDLGVYVAMPLAVFGIDAYLAASNGAAKGIPADYLLILQSAALAQVLNQGVKFVVGRERPYWHFGDAASRAADEKPEDAIMSFYSGHATFAFSLATAGITVTTLRGYKNRWILMAVALPLAFTVPYFRMAADKHYLTDVTVGALSGVLFGMAVPMLHGRTRDGAQIALVPAPNGAALVGIF